MVKQIVGFILVGVSVATFAFLKQPLSETHRKWLFARSESNPMCVAKVKELSEQLGWLYFF